MQVRFHADVLETFVLGARYAVRKMDDKTFALKQLHDNGFNGAVLRRDSGGVLTLSLGSRSLGMPHFSSMDAEWEAIPEGIAVTITKEIVPTPRRMRHHPPLWKQRAQRAAQSVEVATSAPVPEPGLGTKSKQPEITLEYLRFVLEQINYVEERSEWRLERFVGSWRFSQVVQV